jgi:hypothetical protein
MGQATPECEPVPGEVIARSTVKTIAGIFFAAIMLLACVLIAAAYFTGFALPLPGGSVTINWLGGVVACFGLLVTPLLILGLGFMLITKERIVVADDRLQRLQQLGGTDKVRTQIPYRNIARCDHVKEEGVRFVGIDLVDPDDGDSFDADSDFARQKKTYGWHYRIQGGFQEDVSTIQQMLADKLQAFASGQET